MCLYSFRSLYILPSSLDGLLYLLNRHANELLCCCCFFLLNICLSSLRSLLLLSSTDGLLYLAEEPCLPNLQQASLCSFLCLHGFTITRTSSVKSFLPALVLFAAHLKILVLLRTEHNDLQCTKLSSVPTCYVRTAQAHHQTWHKNSTCWSPSWARCARPNESSLTWAWYSNLLLVITSKTRPFPRVALLQPTV